MFMLSFSYYLHEKAEESLHNEAMGLLIAVIGSVFMIGGIIQTVVTVQRPQWFLIFPYQTGSSPYDFLGLAFTLVGIVILLAGVGLGIYYGAQRVWYTNALKEAYRFEEDKLKGQKKVLKEDSYPPMPSAEATDKAQPFTGIPELKPSLDQEAKKEN